MNTTTVAPTAAKITVKATKKCTACEGGYHYEGDYNGAVTNIITCERCHGTGKVNIK